MSGLGFGLASCSSSLSLRPVTSPPAVQYPTSIQISRWVGSLPFFTPEEAPPELPTLVLTEFDHFCQHHCFLASPFSNFPSVQCWRRFALPFSRVMVSLYLMSRPSPPSSLRLHLKPLLTFFFFPCAQRRRDSGGSFVLPRGNVPLPFGHGFPRLHILPLFSLCESGQGFRCSYYILVPGISRNFFLDRILDGSTAPPFLS